MSTHSKKMFALCGSHDEDEDDEKERNHIEDMGDVMLRENESQYSLNGIPLPHLGATDAAVSQRHKQRCTYIITPHNPHYRYLHTFNFCCWFK